MKSWQRFACRVVIIAVGIIGLAGCGDRTAEPPGGESIRAFTQGMEGHAGFIPFYLDRNGGRVYLALEQFETDLIYMHSLPQGVGSNDLGFDRGQLMDVIPALVRFEQVGDKVLLRRLNTQFRAESDNALERQAVAEAFASSVLWGFPVVARDAGVTLVDATDFLLRDSHGIARQLAEQQQGNYRPEASRSALYYPRIKAFPRNTELEASITFVGDNPGEYLRQVAPDPHSFSVRMHHSFIALPDEGYTARRFLPDSGFWNYDFVDYATPITEPIRQRVIPRHRLQKKDPDAALSEAVEPIVYYLDPGTPEPVRTALLDGARWWNQAFEAAGYKDAFQVEMLPEGADPMDVRYNVIQWVHRATRGWSYGYGVVDPRNGEIIKGHVTLGSLRVRQDYLIAQGMTSPFTEEVTDTTALTDMALARIRQLSAHEVGHTLGLAHNFAASVKDRASVMDYPHPRIRLDKAGDVQLDDAYAEGIGDWDKRAIQYGYADFGDPAAEEAALAAFVADGRKQGFAFISDPDSRSLKDMQPLSSLWDNGADAVTELERQLALRAAALADFGSNSIPLGEPYSSLEEVLVPVYFYHRYQVEAAGKWVGGLDFRYALREPGDEYHAAPVSPQRQRRALQVLMATLTPQTLSLPESLWRQIPPKAYGYTRSRESAAGYTGAMLDPVSLAGAAQGHTLDVLLHPERLARLAVQHAADSEQPGISELFRTLQRVLVEPRPSGLDGAVQRRGADLLIGRWQSLVLDTTAMPQVRAAAHGALQRASSWLGGARSSEPTWSEFNRYQAWRIDAFLTGNEQPAVNDPMPLPPGSPI